MNPIELLEQESTKLKNELNSLLKQNEVKKGHENKTILYKRIEHFERSINLLKVGEKVRAATR